MYVTDNHICIGIPKCASRTMMDWVKDCGGEVVMGMHEMSSDPKYYKGRIVFAPVRNPYSRALSIWKHVKKLFDYSDRIEVLLNEFIGCVAGNPYPRGRGGMPPPQILST